MKTSPAANEFFERGMRTGKKPAAMAITIPPTTCSPTAAGKASTVTVETPKTAAPASTITHQYTAALRL